MQFVQGEWKTEEQPQQRAQQVQQPEKKMAAVLPFIEKELEQVISFLKRSHQLSGQIARTIYLLPFKGIDTTEVRKVAETAFAQVGFILDSEGKTSDWQGRERIRDAAGPNSLFRQAVWWFYLKQKVPWLWLEPDCWPIGDNWFQDIEREYFDAAKPFLGTVMEVPNGLQYMNGVAVYPWNAVQFAPLLAQSAQWAEHPEFEVGFDVAGGKDVLSKAHITRKIQLVSHLARGNVAVRPETVLCHGRIDLSGDSPIKSEMGTDQRTSDATQKPFLGRYGDASKAHTEVLDEAPLAARHVPSHETPVQELPKNVEWHDMKRRCSDVTPSQSRKDSDGYGAVSKDIKFHVDELVRLWDSLPHRKVLIVKELRRAKLVPKHFR